ncbi:four helix bundle protein [Haloferula helveola]|uniref:Four helix bundle protein n=2 Tax=Haloferula helveola TaxID=490095 RepID=A0ABN6H4J7_9BACT|nr:four helix bundle protein [Haloferula helveola]
MISGQTYDLEARLIEYAVRMIRVSEALPDSRSGQHIGKQLLRSGTAPAPNYSEAVSAESRRDFIHKVKLALKELRETLTWLKIIRRADLIQPNEKLDEVIKETDELIAILFTSVQTARKNLQQKGS